MIERLKTLMTKAAATLWCHRISYASLAAIYSAGCFGLVDKETVAQVATALYIALGAQRH